MTGRRVLYWLALALVTALMVSYAQRRELFDRYIQYKESEQHVRQLQEQLNAMKQEEARLEQRVEALKQDPLAMEADFRPGKNLVREGETVYRIVSD